MSMLHKHKQFKHIWKYQTSKQR